MWTLSSNKFAQLSPRSGDAGSPMRIATVVFILLSSSAFSQTAAPAATPASPPPAMDSQAEKATDVSDPEKMRRSADALGRMRQVLKDVLGKLEEARSTKDVVKL